MKPQITMEEWAAAIDDCHPRSKVPSGPGWIERDALKEKLGVGRTQFTNKIGMLRRAGRVEIFIGFLDGRTKSWYRLKKRANV